MPAASGTICRLKPLVLVVEDEIVARKSAVEMLEIAGYEAVDACTAADAVCALEKFDTIRLVITDIDLHSSIDGIVLAACIDRRWPDVGIIMTSGKVVPVPGDVPSRARFLPKPYAEARMLDAVRGIIAQDAQ
jgi:DNA-binding NtrC family response regulator